MLEDASNSELLAAWQTGDERAAQVLVRRYMSRLTALARARLSRKLARRLDSEDIVMSAWRSFFAAAGRDQIAVPDDDNLWPLLVTMTLRKLARQADRQNAAKRSIQTEVAFGDGESWPKVVSRDPSPEEAAMVTDEIESLMAALSASDRDILTRRLQGEELTAIAAAAGCSERTVRRALQRARDEYLSRQHTEPGTIRESEITQTDAAPPDQTTTIAGHTQVSAASQRSLPLPDASFDYSDVVLEQLIGQGAFGRVYRSRLADGQAVAVKFLRRNLWKNPLAAGQLIREAAVLAGLTHPGIVRHLGWGRTRAGAVFTVMELVDGQNLASWRQLGEVSLQDAIRCGIELGEALAAAHRAGVIHADLTPANVLRTSDGRFALTDFGFSQVAGEPLRMAAGTPGFLAPEQLCDAFGSVSDRTDVYGIGGIVYFLLTGRPPVTSETVPDAIAETLSSRPFQSVREIVEDVPARLDELIRRCLSKEPRHRPESVESVVRELAAIAG
ncbi:MAG: protein kinase [Planctomycetota bacterium]|nr:protein kinase [Planctomycetota bacterium]MDA1251804.1 protein kinase [Planctomycetota bacterium]